MDKGRHLGYCSLIGAKGSSSEKRKKKMTRTYKNFTIEKLCRRGVYQITDSNNNLIIILPLLSDCKKFIDKKVGA